MPSKPKKKVRKYLTSLVEKEFNKWAKEVMLHEKIDEMLLFGRTLRINKKTGKLDVL